MCEEAGSGLLSSGPPLPAWAGGPPGRCRWLTGTGSGLSGSGVLTTGRARCRQRRPRNRWLVGGPRALAQIKPGLSRVARSAVTGRGVSVGVCWGVLGYADGSWAAHCHSPKRMTPPDSLKPWCNNSHFLTHGDTFWDSQSRQCQSLCPLSPRRPPSVWSLRILPPRPTDVPSGGLVCPDGSCPGRRTL